MFKKINKQIKYFKLYGLLIRKLMLRALYLFAKPDVTR